MKVPNIMRILFTLLLSTMVKWCDAQKPNIVFIFADDLGWNDVSFHGSDQIMTPNIDLLAYSGVALGRYYSHAICTPSRSAFFTGKFAHRTGMQGYPLLMSEDAGIPLSETLLPEYLKAAGYATHLVGKWHVGSSRNEYLPTARGFDSHFGHRGGYVDYYDYTVEETFDPVGTVCGLPLYRNLTPAWDVEGYITDVYTNEATSVIEKHNVSTPLFLMVGHNAPHAGNPSAELQAPPEEVRKLRHIELASRRMYAAMVKKLDDSVGQIFQALHKKGILDNTIIAFVSDNGGMTTGPYRNYASNYPLRGIKTTPFEGGVRVVGALWSSKLNNTGHYWNGYMHVADWMPTLLHAAEVDIPSNIDGINHWKNINSNGPSDRTIMYELNDVWGFNAIVNGDYKLVSGTVFPNFSNHQGSHLRGIVGDAPSYEKAILSSKLYKVLEAFGRPFDASDFSLRSKARVDCDPIPATVCLPDKETVCLFNIIEDPCETKDLSKEHPELLTKMKDMLDKEIAARIPRKVFRNPLSAPRRFNFTWNTFASESNLL